MSRILVVDDEARIRQIIRKYAEFEGFEVEEAVDGMQAIEICRKEDFDLIIMDVMMPELDGFSACREIRKFKQKQWGEQKKLKLSLRDFVNEIGVIIVVILAALRASNT